MPAVIDELLRELSLALDVAESRLRAGQVLVYAGHVPPGVFVLLDGVLEHGGAPLSHRSCVVPPPARLDERLAGDLRAASDAHALFVPRTAVLRDPALRRLLDALRSQEAPEGGASLPEETAS